MSSKTEKSLFLYSKSLRWVYNNHWLVKSSSRLLRIKICTKNTSAKLWTWSGINVLTLYILHITQFFHCILYLSITHFPCNFITQIWYYVAFPMGLPVTPTAPLRRNKSHRILDREREYVTEQYGKNALTYTHFHSIEITWKTPERRIITNNSH